MVQQMVEPNFFCQTKLSHENVKTGDIMKKKDFSRFLFCALLIILLISVSSAFQQYSCFDFDPVIYGKSVQTAISDDGKSIITGSPDSGIVTLFYPNGSSGWSYQTGDNISSVAISRDGRFVSAATYHGNLYFFDNSGKLLWNNTGFGCNNQVALSNDGQSGFVFNSGTKDPQSSDTAFYFIFNGTILWKKHIPQLSVTAVSPDAKNAFLGTWGNYGNDVIMISNDGSEEWRKKMAGNWKVSGAEISDDNTAIAAITDNQILLFNKNGKILANITPEYLVRSIAVSPDGLLIAAGTQYKLVCYNQSGMALWEYPLNDYLYHIDFSHDGQNLVAASRDTIYYFKRDGTFLWKYMFDTKLDSISISQNGEIIVIGNYDNSINIIDQSGNMKKIDLGSISAMPLPPVETGLDIQISPYQGNSTGTVPTTSSAPLQGILPIISIIISAGLISHWVRKQKT
jgi:hypothetical protein